MKTLKLPLSHIYEMLVNRSIEPAKVATVVVSETKRTVTLRCTEEQVNEIASDAAFYADPRNTDLEPEERKIIGYAKTCLKALEKQGVKI